MSNFDYENLSLEPINGSNRQIINDFVRRCKSNNLEGVIIPCDLQQPILDNLTIEDASVPLGALDHLLSGGGCKSLDLSKHYFESESTTEFSQVLTRALDHLENLNIINDQNYFCEPNCPMSEFFLNLLYKNAVPVNLKCLEICCVQTATEIMSILKYCPSLNKLKIRNITLDFDQLSIVNSQLREGQFTEIQRSLNHLDIDSRKIRVNGYQYIGINFIYEIDIMELEVLCEFIASFTELQYIHFNYLYEPILMFMRRNNQLNPNDTFSEPSVMVNFDNTLEKLTGIAVNFIKSKGDNLHRLAQIAPNVTEVKIRAHGQISLLGIEKLEFLKKISLENMCYLIDHPPDIVADFQSLLPVLIERGSNITHLSLVNVIGIDLTKIASLCPNIVHLELDLSNDKLPVKLQKVRKREKFFTELRKLHIKSSGRDLFSYLHFTMKNALKLTTLQINSNHGAKIDSYLSSILKRNPMNNLKYFRLISGSGCIDFYKINKLFSKPEQFPHLRYLNIEFMDPCSECGRFHEFGEPEPCECPFNGYDENCPNHFYLDPQIHLVQL